MNLEVLEPRDALSAYDAGLGFVRFDNGAEVSAFGPGWFGGLNVVQDDAADRVYVGGGPGAGPNLATFDRAGTRVTNDVFAGDPGSREGLVPIIVGGNVPTPEPVSFGPADGYPLYLDGASAAVTAAVYRLFSAVGNVRVTNGRPNLPPGDYATVLVGVPVPVAFSDNDLGVSDVGAVTRPHNPFSSPTAIARTPDGPEVIAHEAGHLFGLTHVWDDPADLMSVSLAPNVDQHFSPTEIRAIHDNAEVGKREAV